MIDPNEVLTEILLYLPDSNVLTDSELILIITSVITAVGDDDELYPEVLCKSLKKISLINQSKASSSYALKREKVNMGEYEWNTGSTTPSDMWRNYINDVLPDICKAIGYSYSIAIGIKVSPGEEINPLSNCDDCGFKW